MVTNGLLVEVGAGGSVGVRVFVSWTRLVAVRVGNGVRVAVLVAVGPVAVGVGVLLTIGVMVAVELGPTVMVAVLVEVAVETNLGLAEIGPQNCEFPCASTASSQ